MFIPPSSRIRSLSIVSNPQICIERDIVLGFAGGITLALPAMYLVDIKLKAREAFVSRVWKRRQYRANKAKGLVAPSRTLGQGHPVQPPPPAHPPPLGSAFPMVTIPAAGQHLQPSTIPGWGATPPTYRDVEAMSGRANDFRPEASSESLTLPATPPPSSRPSWMRSASPTPSQRRLLS